MFQTRAVVWFCPEIGYAYPGAIRLWAGRFGGPIADMMKSNFGNRMSSIADEYKIETFEERKVMREHVYNELNHTTSWANVMRYQARQSRYGKRGKFESSGVAACLLYHVKTTMFDRSELIDSDKMGSPPWRSLTW